MAVTSRGSVNLVTPASGGLDSPTGTISSYTPAVGSILLLRIACDSAAGVSPTITLGGTDPETWTQRVYRSDGEGTAGTVAIYTCTVGTSGARTTTVTVNDVYNNAFVANSKHLGFAEISEKDDPHASPIGNVAEGSSTTNNITPTGPTTANPNADVFAVATDWNALGAATSSDLTETGFHIAGVISGLYGHKSVASAGATSINFDAAGTGAADWNWVAIAIETAGGSSPQELSPGAIASSAAVVAATLTPGAVGLGGVTPNAAVGAAPAASMSSTVELGPGAIAGGGAAVAASLGVGAVELTPGVLAAVAGAPDPTLAAGNQELAPDALAATGAAPAASIGLGTVELSPAAIAAGGSAPAGTISTLTDLAGVTPMAAVGVAPAATLAGGNVELGPGVLAGGAIPSAQLAVGSVELAPAALAAAASAPAAAIASTYELGPAALAAVGQAPAAAIGGGATALVAEAIAGAGIAPPATLAGEEQIVIDAADGVGVVLAVPVDAPGQIKLERDRRYALVHTGRSYTGGASDEPIYVSIASDITPDAQPGRGKYEVAPGAPVWLPPGTGLLLYRALEGSPALQLIPGAPLFGDW